MKRIACLIVSFLMILVFTGAAQAAYKIVIKKNQKVFEGEFVREDATTITINSQGTPLTFKKEILDLDKMKELNPEGGQAASAKQQVVVDTIEHDKPSENVSLADIAKRNRESQTGKGKVFTDKDRKASWTLHQNDPEVQALLGKISALETEIDTLEKSDPITPQLQEIIDSRRKSLEELNYQLEVYGKDHGDQKTGEQKAPGVLESHVEELAGELEELQGKLESASDDAEKESLKKQIEAKQGELAKAQEELAKNTAGQN